MWLFVPQSTSSHSAPGAAVSISESSWQFPVLAASCTSRGRRSPSRTWYLRCRRASWMKRLFGAMSAPSTADRGVALWMASLAASRVSPIPSQATGLPKKTSETFGRQRAGSSCKPGRGSSSLRTSMASSRREDSSVSGVIFADLVMRLRLDSSARQKSAQAIVGGDASFSQWPTPAARDWKGTNSEKHMINGSGRLHLDQLPNFIEHVWYLKASNDNIPPHLRSSLPAQPSGPSGIASFQPPRTLNPLFVEWLMGWPWRWTLVAWIGFGCSETELSRWKRLMRSELLRLGSPSAPPVQHSLFG